MTQPDKPQDRNPTASCHRSDCRYMGICTKAPLCESQHPAYPRPDADLVRQLVDALAKTWEAIGDCTFPPGHPIFEANRQSCAAKSAAIATLGENTNAD